MAISAPGCRLFHPLRGFEPSPRAAIIFDDLRIRRRLGLAHGRQRAADRHERRAGDEQLLGREARDHFVARLR